MKIVKDKIDQACRILDEMDIDMWMIFVRETPVQADPTMDMVVGFDCVWQSFFMYTRKGDAVALVGQFDADNYERSGCFTEVVPYSKSVREDFLKLLRRLDPRKIAINYSTGNPSADGLTHGMYLVLREHLKDTPYDDRLVSAEEFCGKLRARKLPVEVERLKKAAVMANEAWDKAVKHIKPGMTEIEVGRLLDEAIAAAGAVNSFPTIVNAGDKTPPGHSLPSEARVEPGDLLHVDFGVKYEDYCSDLQRLVYFRRPKENEPPVALTDAFETVKDIITATGERCRPGVKGYEVDAVARQMLADNGYPEYQHGLGHQLGRSVHDGAALIGPKWDVYGVAPTIPLEVDNVFTLELEIILPGIGCVGLEEDMRVTEKGAEFLCPRQVELIVR